jgi:hypothetical protein
MPRWSPAGKLQQIQKFTRAWERMAPNSVFYGMTLEQFKTLVRPSEEKRKELLDIEFQTRRITAERDAADGISMQALHNVANGVRGDPAFGPDSALYAALGYVRESAKRRRGKKVR